LKKIFIFLVTIICLSDSVFSQVAISPDTLALNYGSPKEYEIGGISISGTQFLDESVLITLSGLSVGEKISIPGDKIAKALENLWKQGLFSDIQIFSNKVQGNFVFLEIALKERPKLSKFTFKGIGKSDADKLREKLNISKGMVITENLIQETSNTVKDFYKDKGYYNTRVSVSAQTDTGAINSRILIIDIEKNAKIKISKIDFAGNSTVDEKILKRTMKDTKEKHLYRIFSTSKFLESNFTKDKQKILDKYNSMGYRDASILGDSIYKTDDKNIGIKININEGRKYYFRNISWTGNSKYNDKELSAVLGIKKGDIFNQAALESHLMMNQNGNDVSSLYMDDGYLFFQVTPVEINVDKDSIDLEMRIYEGKQARINRIKITGNTKTNDKVIMREVRTKPGQLFSRSDIIRSQRELSQLGYFNAEKLGVNPTPNPADGTVDIEYVVEEKPSDQIELSGGWGGAQGGLVGSLGLSFNNFSARNIGNKNAWKPLPAGDGQKLSIRAQSNGSYYQSYNASFTEPWFGGKKPNSLSVTLYHSILTNGVSSSDASYSSTKITGLSLGFGKRLKFPDDFFTFFAEANFQNYLLNRSTNFLFTDGYSNNFNIKLTFSRNSIDQPLYPRGGSEFSISSQFTPPYSTFNSGDYATMDLQEKYKWVEFHKWTAKASWFTKVIGNLVISTRIKYGILGNYDNKVGQSPFERFYLGGDGLSGFSLYGSDIISLRGYANNSLSPKVGSTVFDKYTFEIRYPLSLNPSATIYGLAFTEAGNAWLDLKDFNPFEMKRSAGFGVRVFLPMFGLLGLDWGYRLDDVSTYPGMDRSTFHFSIGGSID